MTPESRDGDRWIALPSPSRPRFILPVATSSQAVGAMRVYHPVTYRALLGWSIVRVFARAGGLRLLPAVPAPPDLDEIRALHPTGYVAMSNSHRTSRRAGLVLDRLGQPLGFVKVSRDERGTCQLDREAAWVRRLGPLLPPPVRAPTHTHSTPGMLFYEAASWRPRYRSWLLEPDVAAAVGVLYRRGGGDEDRGPAHGDFAPWNLLRLEGGGWLLIDWEDATADGWPFQDPFHWLVQSHTLLGRPTRGSLLGGLRGAGWIGRALDAYARAARLERLDRSDMFRIYLERTVESLRSREGHNAREIQSRLDLLAGVGSR